MYPELFHIGGFTMNSYGVMMALAFISAGFVAYWQFKKRGVKPDFIYGLLIACIIGGLAGAKIHYLILHPDAWPENLLSGEGLVWFGGLFGAIVAVVIVTLVSKQRLAAIMDAGGPAVAVGYAVGRIGCFLRGCDHGTPTDLPWGMTFEQGIPPTTVPVHPTQLYEMAASLVIFALLVWVIGPRFKREGSLIFAFAILHGIQAVLWGLTEQQLIAIAMIVVGAAGVWWFETHGRLRPVVAARKPAAKKPAGKTAASKPGRGADR